MTHLTELELDLLSGFHEGDYMFLEHVVGYSRNPILKGKAVSGVVSSLVQKGIVSTWDDGGEVIKVKLEKIKECVAEYPQLAYIIENYAA